MKRFGLGEEEENWRRIGWTRDVEQQMVVHLGREMQKETGSIKIVGLRKKKLCSLKNLN